jgi:hypothetical protein
MWRTAGAQFVRYMGSPYSERQPLAGKSARSKEESGAHQARRSPANRAGVTRADRAPPSARTAFRRSQEFSPPAVLGDRLQFSNIFVSYRK